MAAREAALVALALRGDVLFVPLPQLLDRLLDHLVAPGLPHRLGAVVGVSTGTVPVTLRAHKQQAAMPFSDRYAHVMIISELEETSIYLDRLWVEGENNSGNLSDPLKPISQQKTLLVAALYQSSYKIQRNQVGPLQIDTAKKRTSRM